MICLRKSKARKEHHEFLRRMGVKLRDIKWALDGHTRYEWRKVKGKRFETIVDAYFATFIATGVAPDTAPDTLLCNDETNPTDVAATPVPYFSAIFRSRYAYAQATHYGIQVDDDPTFGSPIWTSGTVALGTNCPRNARCENINYGGPALSEDGTKYYWRIMFDSDLGPWTNWSTEEAYFVMAGPYGPTAPTDLRLSQCPEEFNPVEIEKDGIKFSAIYNDPESGDIADHYRLQVNSNSSFTGTELWDSRKTSMDNVNEGKRCSEILYGGSAVEEDGTTYYWRIKFWDDEGNEGAWSEVNRFTMAGVKRRDSLLTPKREIVIKREIRLPSST